MHTHLLWYAKWQTRRLCYLTRVIIKLFRRSYSNTFLLNYFLLLHCYPLFFQTKKWIHVITPTEKLFQLVWKAFFFFTNHIWPENFICAWSWFQGSSTMARIKSFQTPVSFFPLLALIFNPAWRYYYETKGYFPHYPQKSLVRVRKKKKKKKAGNQDDPPAAQIENRVTALWDYSISL